MINAPQPIGGEFAEALNLLLATTPIGLWRWRVPEGQISINAALANIIKRKGGAQSLSISQAAAYLRAEDAMRFATAVEMLPSDSEGALSEAISFWLDGSTTAVRVRARVTSRDERGEPLEIVGTFEDTRNQAERDAYRSETDAMKSDQDLLSKQDSMLRIANAIASLLLGISKRADVDEGIAESLRLLGELLAVDHVYLWRNVDKNGSIYCTPLASYTKEGTDPAILAPSVEYAYDDYIPDWGDLFINGLSPLPMISALNNMLRRLPCYVKGGSALALPMFLHGSFWGFIGIDYARTERVFSDFEYKLLQSISLMIASAVSRVEMLQSLIASREEALESTRAKSNFLSRMSHEIRTPMNAIIGMNTIARKSRDFSRIQYCLDKIDEASKQLLGIINDVLDMSKIEANKLEIARQEMDFEQMLQKVFSVVQVKMNEKHQVFSFNIEDMFTRTVISDELRLSQVMINLLNNAVKFTPEGGHISVRVRILGTEESPRLYIGVEDDGIGITAEQQARLFTAFQQADSSITRKFGGTGLGLAICKSILELMDGSIKVESTPGVGSCFSLEVPIQWGRAVAPPKTHSRTTIDALRILVVDDTEDVRVYFRNILKSFSLDCDVADNGEMAVKMVEDGAGKGMPYDFVFLDWRMPGLSGTDTAREIQRLMNGRGIVIMISVSDWSEIECDVREIGIRHYLAKPVLPSTLFNTILELADQSLFFSYPVTLPAQRRDWRGKTILIAEDIEINREIVMNLLSDTGLEIDCAENGVQAVSMFTAAPDKYSVILMDVQMPELDGLDATRLIRSSGIAGGESIPIVAMTSNAFKEDVRACLDAGMNSHIAKPVDVADMMKKLSVFLG